MSKNISVADLLRSQYLFKLLQTSLTVKNSENGVESGCFEKCSRWRALDGRLNQEYQNALVDSSLLHRDIITIPIFHKDGQHWSMASIYPKLKLILHFD